MCERHFLWFILHDHVHTNKLNNSKFTQESAVKMAEISEQIAGWIARKVKEAKCRGAVLGLSGGIDSAVTAALCKKALGGNVLGMILPCESSPTDTEDAEKLAATLGIKTTTVSLDNVYKSLLQILPEGSKLAKANLKPRLRMLTLYYFANTNSCLVVGTGNKSETMVGYSTKYGDSGADLLPLGALYKTEVYQLACELDLPEEIMNKPPSAGLWKGQTDEGELGITYDNLDRCLTALETGKTEDVNPETLARVRTLVAGSAHKRFPPPVCEIS